MRLGPLSTLVLILGLALPLSACGGESVEDRARALKAARKPDRAADPSAPMATAPASASASAGPPLLPPP